MTISPPMAMVSIDKQGHFWAGMAICSTVTLISNLALGFFITLLAATLREQFGNKDLKDLAATVLGSIITMGVLLLQALL